MLTDAAHKFTFPLVVMLLLDSGCPKNTNSTNDGDPDAGQSVSPAMDRIVAAGEEALDGGAALEDAILAVISAAENDPDVAAAAADDVDQRTAWVLYGSGIEHYFQAIDLDEEIGPGSLSTAKGGSVARPAALTPDRPIAQKSSAAQANAPFTPIWKMPASRKALLVNALTRCHALRDIRPTVKAMLLDRGYDVVDDLPLDIDLFRNNTLTQYGVIFIEAHGGIRPPNKRLDEQRAARWNALIGRNIPYCAGAGGGFVIATDVLLNSDIERQYMDDLECGLLKRTTTYIVQHGRRVPCVSTYGVTPDFIRRYNTANFADRTIVLLNACRTLNPQAQSQWADLLAERCKGYHLLGWSNSVHYDTSCIALLNLLQLATGSDYALSMLVPGLSDPNVVLLSRNVPPVGVSTVPAAMQALTARGYDFDVTKGKRKGTGAQLFDLGDFSADDPVELILAPDVRDFWIDQAGQAGLLATCQDHASLRITHDKTQAGVTTADIGTNGGISLGGGWVGGYGAWQFALPAGSSGALTLAQDERVGPVRDLLRWTPTFHISGSGPHGMTFAVDFRMSVRAIPGPRWRSFQVGATVWGTPTDQFDAKFDGGASVVTWQVSGVEEDPPGVTRYSYSGGGTLNLSFVDAQGAFYKADFLSWDGRMLQVDFDCSATLPYTETITDIATSQVTASEFLLPIAGLLLNDIPLAADWSLSPGTRSLGLGGGLTGNVSWGSSAPSPPFNAATMRR